MYISLQELELHEVHFAVDIPAGQIDYDHKVAQSSPLHAEGTTELIGHSLNEVRVRGTLSVKMEAACDRCVEMAYFPLEKGFDLAYVPAGEAPESGEDEIDETASEIGYYDGDGIELDDVLREVVLLALPMQLVCGESCKGICPVCGQNRNQRDCGCQTVSVDDRWSKLKTLRAEISPGK